MYWSFHDVLNKPWIGLHWLIVVTTLYNRAFPTYLYIFSCKWVDDTTVWPLLFPYNVFVLETFIRQATLVRRQLNYNSHLPLVDLRYTTVSHWVWIISSNEWALRILQRQNDLYWSVLTTGRCSGRSHVSLSQHETGLLPIFIAGWD